MENMLSTESKIWFYGGFKDDTRERLVFIMLSFLWGFRSVQVYRGYGPAFYSIRSFENRRCLIVDISLPLFSVSLVFSNASSVA